jgi:hypothetical protein
MRQAATTESLKKLDEMADEQRRADRKQARQKAFAKVFDNYIKSAYRSGGNI